MPEGFSLIHIDGKLTQPVTAFINRVSEAFGEINRPGQMVREAQAEVRANKIRTQGAIEMTDLQRRAADRWLVEETRNQVNIESVVTQAIPHIQRDAEPEKMETDWLAHFFEKSRIVTDKEMQTIWAKVLAGEANSPGTFAKRTLECVAHMEKGDAALFTDVCGFNWTVNGILGPVIIHTNTPPFSDHGMSFDVLSHLDTIGLVHFDGRGGFHQYGKSPQTEVSYFGRSFQLEFEENTAKTITVGVVLLTQIGDQLASISGATPYEGIVEPILRYWKAEGIKIVNEPEGLGVYTGDLEEGS